MELLERGAAETFRYTPLPYHASLEIIKTIKTPNYRSERLCRMCIVQVQPKKHVLDMSRMYGSHPATGARSCRPGNRSAFLNDQDHAVGIDDVSDVRNNINLANQYTRGSLV